MHGLDCAKFGIYLCVSSASASDTLLEAEYELSIMYNYIIMLNVVWTLTIYCMVSRVISVCSSVDVLQFVIKTDDQLMTNL